MKKILGTSWSSFRYHFLQLVLLVIAFFSWLEAKNIGRRVSESSKDGITYNPSTDRFTNGDVAVAVTSGYDGGALAMGLITCACIIGTVWLEVNRLKQRK